ncbi:hypothetical protein K7432_003050 [Basidiobolus ranarum]|uniref:C2H2-type domain-containing protein n=1 Tax=Basidiobolus ranarum TaxID=34480 RepID=A0ABR2W6Z5_9FUNG
MTYSTLESPYNFTKPLYLATNYGQEKPKLSIEFDVNEPLDVNEPMLSLWPLTPYEASSSPNSVCSSLYGELNVKLEDEEFMMFTSPSLQLDQDLIYYSADCYQMPIKDDHEGFYSKKESLPDSCDSFGSPFSNIDSPEPQQYILKSPQLVDSPVQCAHLSESMPQANSQDEFVLSSVMQPEFSSLYGTNFYCGEKSNLSDASCGNQLMEYPLHYFGKSENMLNFNHEACFDSYKYPLEQMYQSPVKDSSNIPYRAGYSKLKETSSRKKRASPLNAMMSTFSSKTMSSSTKKYHCTICQKGFSRPSSLNTHMYSHTGEKPFKCPHEGCGRHFSVVSNLRRHAKIHSCKLNLGF